jgi:hypothetical protein
MVVYAGVADVLKSNLRPERELLLCCARTDLDGLVGERVRELLGGKIDWKVFFQSARCHGLLPLVYRNLNAGAADMVPPSVLEEYKESYWTACWSNVFLTERLIQTLRLFEHHGILAVPLKGPALAATLYGDVTLRDSGDLDILIPMDEVWRAWDLLIAEGFHPQAPLTRSQAKLLFQSPREHHFLLTSADNQVVVELHWRLTQACYAFPLDSDGLWHRLVRVPFTDVTIVSFSPEDLLLILCLHGAKHAWNQLKLVCDVAQLLRAHPDLDWTELRLRVKKIGCERMMNLGLTLAAQMLGVVIPPDALDDRPSDLMLQQLVLEVYHEYLRRDPDNSDPPDKWLFYLRVRERCRDRVRICRDLGEIPAGTDRTLFPFRARLCYYLTSAFFPNQRDRDVVELPGRFAVAYFVIRPVRLLSKYFRRLGKRALELIRLKR